MTALGIVAAVLLLLGNAFFVGAEFASVSVRRAQIEPLAADGNKRATKVLAALGRVSMLLAGAQLGITLCSLGLGAVAEPAVAVLFEDLFDVLRVPTGFAHPIAFAVALALVVLLHMVLGEMVPKNIALASSERAALILVPPLDAFVRGTRVVIGALNALANGGLRVFGIEPQDELKSAYTPDELADILAESRSEGFLDAGEHERLTSALSFGERTARDVLIPGNRLVTVPATATVADVQRVAGETGYSRFPVRSGAGLSGFVHVKDGLVGGAADDAPLPDRFVRPMPRIDATMLLPDVLTTLRRARSHMGDVVSDGRSLGAVALEDVVEEVVGEVSDAAHTD